MNEKDKKVKESLAEVGIRSFILIDLKEISVPESLHSNLTLSLRDAATFIDKIAAIFEENQSPAAILAKLEMRVKKSGGR